MNIRHSNVSVLAGSGHYINEEVDA